jgi:arsenate reductase (thioredoxin)
VKTVLFICEHGSAKSVVAAAHFNRLAAERGLPFHAISRGTDPDAENHPAAVAGLQGEDLQPESVPQRLSAADLQEASCVVAFSELPLPQPATEPPPIWTVPPVSEDYRTSRDAIVAQVERLQESLAREG